MSESVLVAALGYEVRIDVSALDAAGVLAVREAWRDALVPVVEPAEPVEPVDAAPVVHAQGDLDRATMLSELSMAVTLAAIEAARGQAWMLHATGVASDDGRVVALVGPSGRGKTTAARVLGGSYGYVSDETVAVGLEGSVRAYRKPLSIIEHAGEPKVQRAPSELGLRALPAASLTLAAVVLLDRRDDEDGAVVSPVDLGDALGDLVAQTSYLADLERPLQTIAALVSAVGGVVRVTYREAAELVPVVEGLLAAPQEAVAAGAAEPLAAGLVGDGICRVRARDALALEDPDRLALLHVDGHGHGTVRVLAGLGPALWRAADGVALDDLVTVAVAAHGEPEGVDATTAVASAVDGLVAEGVLRRSPLWRIRDDVAWTGSGERVVALALADPAAAPVALEGSAAIIWTALADSACDADTLIQRVAERADVETADVADDVRGFLRTLERGALVAAG
ncbi:PqqD family protein [Microbacterium hominis]|uniref:PqqD family peptide modification chaperone n=1 Tax=Microbacterium hominis TaxID=162426 RepID=A0A7D4U8V6_9MICO|nr:PqqD family protein [Microbacterium hominis]QKJ20306.1 PqqD family peptide modification chaperone [Microbacterium hominis]